MFLEYLALTILIIVLIMVFFLIIYLHDLPYFVEESLGSSTLGELFDIQVDARGTVSDESFDCFILTQTLQHVGDVHAAVGHARRLLRPGGSLLVTLWISGLIERRLDQAKRLDSNLRAALSRFIRAALLVLGGLIALQGIGFDLTVLTVFSGAVAMACTSSASASSTARRT